jgi:branched-chain amino acid transport system substrate-binding protein
MPPPRLDAVSQSLSRRQKPVRVGLALLAVAVVISSSGCGSRASDREIFAALQSIDAVSSTNPPTTDLPGTAVATDVVGATRTAASGAPATGSGSAGAHDTSAGAAEPAGPTTTSSTRTGPAVEAGQSAAPSVADKSVVKVGTVGSFSGVLGAVTSAAPKVLGAWVAASNARGGLNGHPIKLIVGDDQGDPSTALTLTRRMVESDKVLALVGNVNLFGFPQIEQYLRGKNIPMIGGDAVDPGWSTSPITFPVSPSGAVQVIKGFKKFVDEGSHKLAMFYCIEVATLCSYLHEEAQKSEVGPYLVQSYQVSLVAPSYTSQCLRMKQAGIEVLFLIMDTAGAARAAQDCANQGYRPKLVLGALDATKDMPGIAALRAAFVPGATVSPGATGIPALQRYHDSMAVYGPNLGDSGFGLLGWAAGELLGVVGQNLTDSPTSEELFTNLWKVRNEDLGGLTVPFTFSKRKPAEVKQCVFIWGTADGKFTAPQGSKLSC